MVGMFSMYASRGIEFTTGLRSTALTTANGYEPDEHFMTRYCLSRTLIMVVLINLAVPSRRLNAAFQRPLHCTVKDEDCDDDLQREEHRRHLVPNWELRSLASWVDEQWHPCLERERRRLDNANDDGSMLRRTRADFVDPADDKCASSGLCMEGSAAPDLSWRFTYQYTYLAKRK